MSEDMQTSTKTISKTFHMGRGELFTVLEISLLGIAFAVGLFWSGVGDLIKTIVLFVLSVAGLVFAFRMTIKLEIADSELIITHLASKRVIAREDIDAYFLDQQGWNRRTRDFVTIHLVNGQRVRFKGVKEGNDSLLRALERFTGLPQAVDSPKS